MSRTYRLFSSKSRDPTIIIKQFTRVFVQLAISQVGPSAAPLASH